MERVRLPDGTRIDVRPLEAEDRELLADAAAHLSPESIYRRFLAPIGQLSESQVAYLMNVDHDRHEALVASHPRTGEAVAFARYVVVCEAEPPTAEVAMTVVDAWQGRGVGARIIACLAQLAVCRGIERFCAVMLSDNVAMARLMNGIGDVVDRRSGAGTLELTVSLEGRPPGVDGRAADEASRARR